MPRRYCIDLSARRDPGQPGVFHGCSIILSRAGRKRMGDDERQYCRAAEAAGAVWNMHDSLTVAATGLTGVCLDDYLARDAGLENERLFTIEPRDILLCILLYIVVHLLIATNAKIPKGNQRRSKENVRNDAKTMKKKRYYSAEEILHPVFSVQLFFSPTDALLLRCSHVR